LSPKLYHLSFPRKIQLPCRLQKETSVGLQIEVIYKCSSRARLHKPQFRACGLWMYLDLSNISADSAKKSWNWRASGRTINQVPYEYPMLSIRTSRVSFPSHVTRALGVKFDSRIECKPTLNTPSPTPTPYVYQGWKSVTLSETEVICSHHPPRSQLCPSLCQSSAS
jgi:hypothetical protein